MFYNAKEILLQEAQKESAITNNIEDIRGYNSLQEEESKLDESFVNIPFNIDTVHLMKVDENYIIPFDDLVKIKKISDKSLNEVMQDIAEYYNISRSNIVVDSNDLDNTALGEIAYRLQEAATKNIPVYNSYYWEDVEIEDDEYESIEESILAEADEYSELTNNVSTSFKFTVDAVNVYNEDFDYFVEMSEVNRFMDDNDIDSIWEAIHQIALHNDIDMKRISILYEACKSKKKKDKKKKALYEACKAKKKKDKKTKGKCDASKC